MVKTRIVKVIAIELIDKQSRLGFLGPVNPEHIGLVKRLATFLVVVTTKFSGTPGHSRDTCSRPSEQEFNSE